MKQFNYVITDSLGLHARPAGQLVKEAKKYVSEVKLCKEDKMVDAKRVLAVMGLSVKQGQKVTVIVEGEDEDMAVDALKALFKESF